MCQIQNDELYKILNNIYKTKLISKFNELGNIRENETALVLAAKRSNKDTENSIFVISDSDTTDLSEQIKKLLENDTDENVIKFQIIYFSNFHAIFGQFEIDKTSKPFVVRYAHIDPLPSMIDCNKIFNMHFILSISPLANIEVYDSLVVMQKGLGCSYFSIDGAKMLATPSDRNYAVDVINHMKTHGVEKKHFNAKNVKYVECSSLPIRFIRGMQQWEDVQELNHTQKQGLQSLLAADKKIIVNKKGETAEESINKNLERVQKKTEHQTMVTYNLRAKRKMKKYQATLTNYLEDRNVIDPNFSVIINQYKIKGLMEFCDKKIKHQKKYEASISIQTKSAVNQVKISTSQEKKIINEAIKELKQYVLDRLLQHETHMKDSMFAFFNPVTAYFKSKLSIDYETKTKAANHLIEILEKILENETVSTTLSEIDRSALNDERLGVIIKKYSIDLKKFTVDYSASKKT